MDPEGWGGTPYGAVAFVREQWSTALDMAIPRAQLARVSSAGDLLGTALLDDSGGYPFALEARIWPSPDGLVALWISEDLMSATDQPPARVLATPLGPGATLR